MNLFDAIKDAFTVDDGERLAAAEKELTHLQDQLNRAKAANNIGDIADIQGKIAAAEGQINDLKVKLGQAPAAPAEAPVEAPAAAPVAEAPAPAPAPEPAAPAPAPEAHTVAAEYRTYEVKPGDTLSKIGREYGVNYMDIVKLNGIEDPDMIYPGQVFKIPN